MRDFLKALLRELEGQGGQGLPSTRCEALAGEIRIQLGPEEPATPEPEPVVEEIVEEIVEEEF